MNPSPLVSAGEYILQAAQLISFVSWYVYIGVVIIVVAFLLLRYLNDVLRVNPFGRWFHLTSHPADRMIKNMRQSRFYLPLKRALNFDPAILMLLISTAIVCYVIALVINYFIVILSGLGNSLIAFGAGSAFTGVRFLTGTILLCVIFFLLSLMLIVFVNWIFGFFTRAAYRALERIAPLLRIFEFGGVLAGWSFLILGIALSFAASAVQLIFLS
jgi:hypothetical protein